MLPDGTEVALEVEAAWEGYLIAADDIGCQLKAVYVPIRSPQGPSRHRSCPLTSVTRRPPAVGVVGAVPCPTIRSVWIGYPLLRCATKSKWTKITPWNYLIPYLIAYFFYIIPSHKSDYAPK